MVDTEKIEIKESFCKDLVIGTAQIAAPYGSVVKTTPPSAAEVDNIIDTCSKAGISGFDTARTYKDSEKTLGRALCGNESNFQIITKLEPFSDASIISNIKLIRDRCAESIRQSQYYLGEDRKLNVLLHRASHFNIFEGVIWEELIEFKSNGLINRIGVSVQTPEEFKFATNIPEVDIIQLPINLIDNRWDLKEKDLARDGAERIQIHARSIFLQGILLRESSKWPKLENINPSDILRKIDFITKELSRKNAKDLCISYIRGQELINYCVIGIETNNQLKETVELFKNPPLKEDEINFVKSNFQDFPNELLNPALWP